MEGSVGTMLFDEVTVETAPGAGELGRALETLARAGVSVLGIASTPEVPSAPGVHPNRARNRIRLVLDDPIEGAAALKHQGWSVRVRDALGVPTARPVELEAALAELATLGMDVRALYLARTHDGVHPVLSLDNAEKAALVLDLPRKRL